MTLDRAKRRPTIDDVASAAGVSRGTVSRVLNGGHWVSPDSHASVTAAIKKTGYRINPHARSLATARAHSVAFLLTEPHDQLFEDPNFSILMRGAATALDAYDESLVLIMASSPDEQRRALEFIGAGHVDGVLLVSAHSGGAAFVGSILKLAVPTISCGAPLGVERRMGYVAADDEHGGYLMTEHLLGLGRQRVAMITGPQDTTGGRSRLAGYRAALADARSAGLLAQDEDEGLVAYGEDEGLVAYGEDEGLVAYGDYGRASGAAAMRELLERRPDLDAVFAANDRMAAAAIEVLRSSGRRVPEDVAVGGFDDSPAATQSSPSITTMRQPFERISREMVRLLLEQIDGGSPASVILPTELVRRESA